MLKIKSATRLALTIGVGCASLVWLAVGLGLTPSPENLEIKGRVALTKAIAVTVTSFAENKRTKGLETLLSRAVQVEKEINSIGIYRAKRNRYSVTTAQHEELWDVDEGGLPGEQISVEILANGAVWGTLQIAFKPLRPAGYAGLFVFPFALIMFISSSVILLTWGVLGKTFKYLNPSRVVPDRVRSALDTLAEGLALIDPSGEIAHANQSFSAIVNKTDDEILACRIDSFGWTRPEENVDDVFPWTRCLQEESPVCGEIVQLKCPNLPSRKYVVNATPIQGANGAVRGVLASFDDVTAMEQKNTELAKMISTLRRSRDEVARQNEQLSFLASYDTLTKCMNRRAFFSQFEELWKQSDDGRLTIMMLDVDHFKAVNDNHGHSVGDEVLKKTGELMRELIGDRGLVCRYGGEEFVILIPDSDVSEGMAIAEEVRRAIETTPASGVSFTASLGLSSRSFGSMDAQHMLDQADESLYTAKRNGRNRVIRFDERENFPGEEESEDRNSQPVEIDEGSSEIPYSAVSGLLSALSFRCQDTAKHSMRVADLCVAIGEQMMNKRELYRLEVSALLHDIGKIGVPDAVLHKPGKLTPDEWKLMKKHDAIGVEIVLSAFASSEIASVINSHHYCYSARSESMQSPSPSEPIPLAARILTVCDAFDSMTNDQCYRAGVSDLEALEEIVKHSPAQFDPEVVTKLVAHIQAGNHRSTTAVDVLPSTQSALAISKHIEDLYTAIAEEDVTRLQEVVGELKQNTSEAGAFFNAANRLDDAIGEDDLEKVLLLAKEVMDVCRATRSTIVETAGSVVTSIALDEVSTK